jgi:hypothetical protein
MTLNVVMQNDGNFVDIILLYLRFPRVPLLKINILNEVTMMMFILSLGATAPLVGLDLLLIHEDFCGF